MLELWREYLEFLKERKKFILVPIFIVLLILSALVFFSSAVHVSPFVYTIY